MLFPVILQERTRVNKLGPINCYKMELKRFSVNRLPLARLSPYMSTERRVAWAWCQCANKFDDVRTPDSRKQKAKDDTKTKSTVCGKWTY
jgi:hypothetical protein